MKCDMCGNERAVVFVQQIDGDARSELRLCSECAKARGLTHFEGNLPFSVKELFENLSDPVGKKTQDKGTDPNCPRCASRLSDLKAVGRAGCPFCYEIFADELFSRPGSAKTPLRHVGRIGLMQAGKSYPGKSYPGMSASGKSASGYDISKLREDLRLALASEDYETAALCRDRILNLETSGGA